VDKCQDTGVSSVADEAGHSSNQQQQPSGSWTCRDKSPTAVDLGSSRLQSDRSRVVFRKLRLLTFSVQPRLGIDHVVASVFFVDRLGLIQYPLNLARAACLPRGLYVLLALF